MSKDHPHHFSYIPGYSSPVFIVSGGKCSSPNQLNVDICALVNTPSSSSSKKKIDIALDTPQSSSRIGVLDLDNSSIASSDIKAFQEKSKPVSKVNKVHWELALPATSHSPPDLTIENRPSAIS